MAIVKNNFMVSRLDGDFSPGSRYSISSYEDDDELQKRSSGSESDDYDNSDEVDSGAGSDGCDLLELVEIGTELCQVGNQNCSVPFDLYEILELGSILSLDTWNNCLTEDERFSLAKYLPDMDQETFILTLQELFSASNFHFGSPLVELFDRLKGGLCEPRVALYRQGLNFFQKRQHYHGLCKYQNSMVGSLIRIRDTWENCGVDGIEERLRILNIVRSQGGLMYYKDGDLETDSTGEEEFDDAFWAKKAKMGCRDVHMVKPSLDVSSQGKIMDLEPQRHGKQIPKGILKVAAPKSTFKEYIETLSRSPSVLETKSRPSVPLLALPRQDQAVGYDLGTGRRNRNQIGDDDNNDTAEQAYKMDGVQRDMNATRGSSVAKVSLLKPGKQNNTFKKHDWNVNQMVDVDTLTGKLINDRISYDYQPRDAGKKSKYPEEVQRSMVDDWTSPVTNQVQRLLLKGSRVDWLHGSQPFWHGKTKEEAYSMDHSVKNDDWAIRSKKWKMAENFKTGKINMGPDSKVNSNKTFITQMNDSHLYPDHKFKTSQEKIRKNSTQNGGMNIERDLRGSNIFTQSEETESDSSEQNEDEDISPSIRKLGYPSRVLEGRRSSPVKLVHRSKKVNKIARKDNKEYSQVLDDVGKQLHTTEVEIYSKGKQKGKMSNPSYVHDYSAKNLEGNSISESANLSDDRKQNYKSAKNGQMQSKLHLSLPKTYSAGRKQKGKVDLEYSVPQSNYMHDHVDGSLEEDLLARPRLVDGHTRSNKSGRKGQKSEVHANEGLNLPLLRCISVARKRKGKVEMTYFDGPDESNYMQSSPQQQQIDDSSLAKKRGKKKVDAEASSMAMVTSDLIIPERGAADIVPEPKPVKKLFTLITPTVHTGFSFSIVHLLSAVRIAMTTMHAEDLAEVDKHLEKSDGTLKPMKEEQNRKPEVSNGVVLTSQSHENLDVNSSEYAGEKNLLSLTVQEIVNRVRSNPGDPCILETQEPLQDLVRGVLKIFSSKTAPLGAKGWKALVVYDKSTKSWSWIGPLLSSSLDHDTVEEVTSSEAWGVPHRMLVKLVDAFANWLKNGQETLQQIGSLPSPPMTLMLPNMDERERFRDLRAQKSLITISPSSDEVRAYFRREEFLRYSIPDRAFSYTAADGKKSIVAPLRRGGGKPTSKARDHFMLKTDRPPHVTILCLVRDAAARLPGSIGTRADVCTLIRDSQYIVEDVSDAQINQVVSGALDRLHYERDPCVQFDSDRKLWVYLHRERDEEDFEDDGTSSTKKWKRQRKDITDQSDLGTVNDVAYQGTGEQVAIGPAAGYDFSSDFNVETSSIYPGEKAELVHHNLRPKIEENIEPFIDLAQGSMQRGHPMGWEVLKRKPLRENKMLCQENSTNEDFDDESFSRERSVGLLSASLM